MNIQILVQRNVTIRRKQNDFLKNVVLVFNLLIWKRKGTRVRVNLLLLHRQTVVLKI